MEKILEIGNLLKKISTHKFYNKKIILCHGVFDLLHIGHIKYFEEAKSYGDILIVSITSDKFVRKGVNRPYFSEMQRAHAISSIKVADYIIINNNPTSIDLIKKIKPNVYVKGPDYKEKKLDITGNIYLEEKAAKKVNCKVVYTESETYSSSKLLDNFFEKDQIDQKKFIKNIKNKSNAKKILDQLEIIKKKNILLIGDAIFDEYILAEALNKSSKDSILTFSIKKKEKYLGGSLAIANNLAEFCNKVNLICKIGKSNDENSFISKNLKKNIRVSGIKAKNFKTILKSRVINDYDSQKQIGLYDLENVHLKRSEEEKIIYEIKKIKHKVDHVVISDFGHGLITDKILMALKKLNKSIFINSQINSTNIGQHSLDRFKKLDFMSLNYMELRHEMRNDMLPIKQLTKKLCEKLKLKKIFVTNGSEGSILFNKKLNSFTTAPALTNVVKDRIGSGDSFFSLASLMSFVDAKDIESIFLGSLASYFNLQNFANKKTLDSIEIKKAIIYTLK